MTAASFAELEAQLAEQDEPQLTPDEYKTVFRQHAAGVAVVTLVGPEGPVGFTATSVISVSAAPPLLAFSVDSASSSWPALSGAATLVVNFLAEDQADVSARFATRGVDRFAGVAWSTLASGEPVLHGTQAWVRGRVLQRVPVGTSHLVSLRALAHGARPDAAPLVYRDRAYHRLEGLAGGV
ncbi:flavin reductase family protein [Cellulomonas endophytica]|uniref:flavin reductase family protein n=1 Tax=Cellulomonas endophytica TaxID=2494735 RepID=UPI001011F934|nr:flavin reductase family protein [Cellulomonas endophytica]